jgi:hypothetical protein
MIWQSITNINVVGRKEERMTKLKYRLDKAQKKKKKEKKKKKKFRKWGGWGTGGGIGCG